MSSQMSQLPWYHFGIISYLFLTQNHYTVFQTFLLVFAIASLANVLFLIPPLCLLMTLLLGLVLEAMERVDWLQPLNKLYFFQGIIITWEANGSQDFLEFVLCS